MQRDMNLIREIAFCVEVAPDQIDSSTIQIEGYSAEQIGYHCALMKEAKLIEAIDTTCLDSRFSEMLIQRLTWAGHDFVDAAKNDTVWNKVIRRVKEKVTAMAFDAFVSLLKAAGQSAVGPLTEWAAN